ncbi:PREDICTED: 60S ribosomal protein L7-3-like isoform X2 [Camelina sativa]|nr:PREDICTED: 60S ribosomal protein L7-3-like isoform X2 [Camelina sativa]XP_010514512.1 PREDICTED: 60S ribosomal protein L7-3-like isoform X2 [Camelina sativa]XP_010514513.1 PREDICTED: 60S ribosomal protein L7-3-like isoform X2 [Camelina sativa]
MAETKVVVPESVLKKIKRQEEWALAKKEETVAAKKKSVETRKLIFKRAEQYAKEYAEKNNELIRFKREAKLKGGFYVDPEAKLLFIIRIHGINAIDPKTINSFFFLSQMQLKLELKEKGVLVSAVCLLQVNL